MKKVKQMSDSLISGEKINVEALEALFTSVLTDAKKSNDGNLAAATRFRVATATFGHASIAVRKITPKSK